MAQSTAAIRGACRGPPAPGSCSAITSPLFLSYAAPVGVLAVAWRRAATVVLTCYPPAGDSPSPPSAPGNPAASPPSCGPRTSICPAARPAPGDTEGTGSVRGCPAWPPRPHPHGLPGRGNRELLGRVFPTPIPPQGFCKGPHNTRRVIPTEARSHGCPAMSQHRLVHSSIPLPGVTLALQNAPTQVAPP